MNDPKEFQNTVIFEEYVVLYDLLWKIKLV